MRIARTLSLALAALAAGLTVFAAGCTNLVFQPLRPHLLDPRTLGVLLEDRSFAGEDGIVLHGWWLPARDAAGHAITAGARGTVIFLHGNAENISTHIGSVHWLPNAGYNVYLYDYRGFGKSGGVVDYDWARRDLYAAIDFVAGFAETRGTPIYVFGQSIGGAIALSALGGHPARDRLAGLVVEGAPASLRRMGREVLAGNWLTWALQVPLSWLVEDAASPVQRIGAIAPLPLLLAHSSDDRVVPPQHGEDLRRQAPPGTVWFAARGPHIAAFTPPAARQVLLDFLAAPPPTRAVPAPALSLASPAARLAAPPFPPYSRR